MINNEHNETTKPVAKEVNTEKTDIENSESTNKSPRRKWDKTQIQ